MSQFDTDTFVQLIKNFNNVKKRILQNRPVSTKETKINEYIDLLIENYNLILNYTKTNSENLTIDTEYYFFSKIQHCRELLVRCFGKLNCNVKVPENIKLFELVNKNVMTDDESDSEKSKETTEVNTVKLQDNNTNI